MARHDDISDTDAPVVGPAALALDPTRYAAGLAEFDLTEEQQQALLATLWSIMQSFVELGFTAGLGAALLDGLTVVPSDADLN